MNIYKSYIVTIFFMLLAGNLNARPITYYQYFSVVEPIYCSCKSTFGRADTLWGAVRSNDYISIKHSATFHSYFITSAPALSGDYRDPYFAIEPIFNAPEIEFPEQFHHIAALASIAIGNNDDRYMTRLFLHDGQLDVYRYLIGLPVDLELTHSFELREREIVMVDSKVEIHGEVSSDLTIYATDDIYLIDDIKYVNTDEYGRWEDEEDPGGMLGIVTEGDIIIKDNWANGRQNMERGSDIIINGSLVALGGSFTFEHQNNDWEQYQGPEPDWRGYIYLKGGLAQRTRALTYTSNHTGTGFGKHYDYDYRLIETGPPGFSEEEYPYIDGQYDELIIRSGKRILNNVVCNRLVVNSGVELVLDGENALTVRGNIQFMGREDQHIIVRYRYEDQRADVNSDGGDSTTVNFQYVNFADNISFIVNGASIDVSNCSFEDEVYLEASDINVTNSWFEDEVFLNGSIRVDSSRFNGLVTLTSLTDLAVYRNVFTNGVVFAGNVENGNFVNNTVVDAPFEGLLINRFRSLRIANNIIAFNRWGIINWDPSNPVLTYNDLFENNGFDYIRCSAGEGTIVARPLFRNKDAGDYNIELISPCVDAGDPESPLDLDGSRADIGAFAINHALAVPDDALLPNNFSVSAFPNPFNDVVKININAPNAGVGNWKIVDINGRIISSGSTDLITGSNSLILTGKQYSTAGLYFLAVDLNGSAVILKVVYVN